MPVSRKRKRHPHSRLMGLLRGSNRSELTVSIARSASDDAFEDAARWSVLHLKARGPLQRLRPRKIGDLYQGSPLKPLALKKELVWAREIILQHREPISAQLVFKARVEAALIEDDFDQVINLLDELEATQGYSLFSISTRIATLQLYRGLEAQKEFLQSVRSQKATENLPFFGYWWSIRCEESSSKKNFERDFGARLKRWSIEESFRAHIAFEVLRQVPSEGEEAALLCGSYLASAFDVYQAVIALAETTYIEGRSTRGDFLPLLRKFKDVFSDTRINKILYLAGQNEALDGVPSPSLDWRNALVSKGSDLPPGLPSSLEEIRAAALLGKSFGDDHPFARRLADAFGSRLLPEQTARGQAALSKLGAMFDHLSTGEWLSAYAADPHLLDNEKSKASAIRRFVNTATLEPEISERISSVQRAQLQTLLPSTTENAYLQWIERLVGKDGGSDSKKLNRKAELQLDLLAAIAAERFEDLLRLASEFHEVCGGHSHLSLNALLQGEMGLRGVAAAATFVVDRLLEDPKLAAWLPIEDVANEVLKEEVDASLIDIPILLQFASQERADPFASERTYAVEDYLASQGALRPTDLTSRIDRSAANPKELYFFRECCAVSGLRVSTLFQNETELEEERIALCQWLIQDKNDQAEVLEEEARELVRGKSVRQGLKELEGSKLSIDSAGLRQWAGRALREDYNRYIDLLESGVFVVDEEFKQAVLDAIGSERPDQSNLKIPDNESAELLGSIVTRAIREFALHSEHGLDAYLSLRIRHGTISGHLRGPIEELNIITRRRADMSYLPNEYWIERLGGALPYELIRQLDEQLGQLSQEYDELIERLTNELIQVRTADKPNGLIPVEVSSALMAAILAETNPSVSFDDFMVRCEDIFWVIVSSGAGLVSTAIEDIENEIHAMFDGAEQRVRDLGGEATAPLRDALLRGKGIALSQLEKIEEWLQPPTTQGSIALDIDALVNVSLSVLQGFYNTFQPKIELHSDGKMQLQGAVRWFSDVFFILFENVLKYSGNATDPKIEITFMEETEHLSFRVVNSVDNMTAEKAKSIEEAREKIRDGSFRTAVRSEGGTGLPKLAKVIGVGKGGELDFQYDDENSTFAVQFKVPTLEIAGGDTNGRHSDR